MPCEAILREGQPCPLPHRKGGRGRWGEAWSLGTYTHPLKQKLGCTGGRGRRGRLPCWRLTQTGPSVFLPLRKAPTDGWSSDPACRNGDRMA